MVYAESAEPAPREDESVTSAVNLSYAAALALLLFVLLIVPGRMAVAVLRRNTE